MNSEKDGRRDWCRELTADELTVVQVELAALFCSDGAPDAEPPTDADENCAALSCWMISRGSMPRIMWELEPGSLGACF